MKQRGSLPDISINLEELQKEFGAEGNVEGDTLPMDKVRVQGSLFIEPVSDMLQ